jgi:hypothetical protein
MAARTLHLAGALPAAAGAAAATARAGAARGLSSSPSFAAPVLPTAVNPLSEHFAANSAAMGTLVAALRAHVSQS